MDPRLIALGGAGLAGLVAGGAFWALSGGRAQGEALEAMEARLAAITTRGRTAPDRPSEALGQVLALPLFAPGAQPAATPTDVTVQVFGLVRTPGRTAALLGIGGAQAEWLVQGESRAGVTLRSVSSAGVRVATLFGEREVNLGTPSQASPSSDAPPPSYKSPPPPASAPGMPQ